MEAQNLKFKLKLNFKLVHLLKLGCKVGGISAPHNFFLNMVEKQLFKSLSYCVIHENNSSPYWFFSRNVFKKKVLAEKL